MTWLLIQLAQFVVSLRLEEVLISGNRAGFLEKVGYETHIDGVVRNGGGVLVARHVKWLRGNERLGFPHRC